MSKPLYFRADGSQNIVCLDGSTLVFACKQCYFFTRDNAAEGDETATVDCVTIPALTPVADGMAAIREYLTQMNVDVEKAAEMMNIPEILYEAA